MLKSALVLGFFGLTFVVSAGVSPAHAQATRTWVSGVGDDANPCSRTAPCKTFAGAISKTSTAGEIDTLDPGGFGALTITKSITIINGSGGESGVLVSGTNGINVVAGATGVVNLIGLQFDGVNASQNGILISSAAQVTIKDCLIQEFGPGTGLAGINVAPTAAGTTQVQIQGTTIVGNNAGVIVKPSTGATVNLSIEHSKIVNNSGGGVRADGTGGGTIVASVSDSSMSLNAGNGLISVTGPGSATVDLTRDVFADNVQFAITSNQTSGGTSTVTVGNSTISNNAAGPVSFSGGGTLKTYQNNQVTGPAGTGTGFSGTINAQ
jgi:hypothetical protein